MSQLTTLIEKLKKIHDVYEISTTTQQERLFNASSQLIGDLVTLGFDRSFIESTLMFGSSFLLSEEVPQDSLWAIFL